MSTVSVLSQEAQGRHAALYMPEHPPGSKTRITVPTRFTMPPKRRRFPAGVEPARAILRFVAASALHLASITGNPGQRRRFYNSHAPLRAPDCDSCPLARSPLRRR